MGSDWLDVATKAFVRHEFHSSAGPSFEGALRAGSLAGLASQPLSVIPAGVLSGLRSYCAWTTANLTASSYPCNLEGKSSASGRPEAVNDRGSFVLLDTRRPYTLSFDDTKAMVLKIARVPKRLAGGSRLLPTRWKPIIRLPDSHRDSFQCSPGGSIRSMVRSGLRLPRQALDLVALAFSTETQQSEAFLSLSLGHHSSTAEVGYRFALPRARPKTLRLWSRGRYQHPLCQRAAVSGRHFARTLYSSTGAWSGVGARLKTRGKAHRTICGEIVVFRLGLLEILLLTSRAVFEGRVGSPGEYRRLENN